MSNVSWADVREGGLRLDEVEETLGIDALQIGDEDWAVCPLPDHPGDRSGAHFSINRETLLWSCFTCGGGGALPLLVQRCLGLDKPSAINWLCQYSDVNPDVPVEQWVRKLRNRASRIHTETFERPPVLPWMPERLIEPYELAFARDTGAWKWVYDKWGVEWETMFEFRLGLAPDYNWKNKLEGSAIIVPHFWRGKLVGWQARWMDPEMKPKYVNTDDFPKQYTLYNWDRVAKRTDPLLVVESFATVMKLHMYEYPAVATFGASVSRHQEDILARYRGPLFLAYDNDAAGQSTQRALSGALKARRNVWMVPPAAGDKADIADLTKTDIEELLGRARPGFLATPEP